MKIDILCALCLATLHPMSILQPHARPDSGSDRGGLSVRLIKASQIGFSPLKTEDKIVR